MHDTNQVWFSENAAGKSVKCLSEVSAVREAAGLGNFKQASDVDKISDPKQGNLDDGSQWKNICEYLIPVSGAEYF